MVVCDWQPVQGVPQPLIESQFAQVLPRIKDEENGSLDGCLAQEIPHNQPNSQQAINPLQCPFLTQNLKE